MLRAHRRAPLRPRLGLLELAGGFRVTVLFFLDAGQAVQRVGLSGPVAGFAAQGQGLLEVAGSFQVAVLPFLDDAQVGQRAGLPGPVTSLAEQDRDLLVVVGCLLVAALPAGRPRLSARSRVRRRAPARRFRHARILRQRPSGSRS